MKNHRSKFSLFLIVLMLVLSFNFSFATDTFANDIPLNSYTTEKYDINVDISSENRLSYEEDIAVTLHNASDEFVFKFPMKLVGRIKNVSVAGYKSEFDTNTNELKIFYKNSPAESKKNFTISYTILGVDYYGERPDLLEIPLVVSDWDSDIKSLSININYFEGFKWDNIEQWIGTEHNRDNLYGIWKFNSNKRLITLEAKDIPARTGVSVKMDLPLGFWASAKNIENVRFCSVSLLIIGILIFLFARVRYGRPIKPLIVRQQYPPYDVSPAMVGYLYDDFVDDDNLWSTIIHLAHRGYMNIIEYEKGKFEFEFIKYPKKEQSSTRAAFKAIFGKESYPGRIVRLEDCAETFRHYMPKYRSYVRRDVMGTRMVFMTSSERANRVVKYTYFLILLIIPLMNYGFHYRSDSMFSIGFAIGFLFSAIMTTLLSSVGIALNRYKIRNNRYNKLIAYSYLALYICLSGVYIYFYRFAQYGRPGDGIIATFTGLFLFTAPVMLHGMRNLSKKNAERSSHILGLLEFLNTASKEEVLCQSKKDKDYFFKLLPYAFVFDNTKRLASIFEYVDIVSPSWYLPYGMEAGYKFDVLVMNSMTTSLYKELKNAVLTNEVQRAIVAK